MTHRQDHHAHSHTHAHFGCGRPHGPDSRRRPGLIRRVTQFVADKTGLPRRGVLALLIVGLIMNLPLTVVIFVGLWLWTEHADSVRHAVDRAGDALRDTFQGPRTATAGGPGAQARPRPVDPDSEFADLRRAFDDLERRATSMERHVTSEEYELNRQFQDMARQDKGPDGSHRIS